MLLQGRDDYSLPSAPVALAPFNLELISLPSSLEGAPEASALLGADDRLFLEEQERMVRPDPPHSQVEPYWDPSLKFNRSKYRALIQRLHRIGYLVYTLEPIDFAGLFFVWKSDKKKIRMIVDGRRANQRLRDPPGVDLLSAEGLSKFEVCTSFEGSKNGHPELHVGLSDVRDCFHRIRQPMWLSRHFCLQPIEARHVGLTGKLLDRVLQSNDLVYPAPGSLCMGCSWSLYFAQRISERLMSSIPSLSRSCPMSDRGELVVFVDGDQAQVRHYTYVDNLGIISTSEDIVRQGLVELEETFTKQGLLLHPGEIQSSRVKALRVNLDGSKLCTRLTPERFHRVRQGIRGLLRRRRVSGRTVEIVLGHATFCALANRRLLSIFHSVYKFIRKSYSSPIPLWPSACDELRAFAGLMVFLQSDWCRPWNELVTSTDASEQGYGLCTSWWPREVVASIGRVSERSRFKRTGGHSARESALGSAGFIQNPDSGQWGLPEEDVDEYMDKAGWSFDSSFEEVPAELLHKSQWEPKSWGRWKRAENILILEARALLGAVRRVCGSKFGLGHRQLCLVDNLSLALCFERCRSQNFKVLRVLRQACAYQLVCNTSVAVRWIPSELNSADGPSRADDPASSKNLSGVIPRSLGPGCRPSRRHGPKDQQEEESSFSPGFSKALGKSSSFSTSSYVEPRCAESEFAAGVFKFAGVESSQPQGEAHQPAGVPASRPQRDARAKSSSGQSKQQRGQFNDLRAFGREGASPPTGQAREASAPHLRGPHAADGEWWHDVVGEAGGQCQDRGLLRSTATL